MRADLLAGVGLSALAAFFGAGLPGIDAAAGYSGLSPRFAPTAVALGLAGCALLLMLARAAPPAPQDDADVVAPARSGRRLALVAGGLLLHLAIIGSLGFVVAGTLLTVLAARGHGSRRPLRDAAVGVALTLPLWGLFAGLVGLRLPLLPIAGL